MPRLIIAKISKPQGIRGELKCQVLTDILAVFDGDLKEFYVDGKLMYAEHVSYRQGAAYIKFKGIDTRNDAELYRNQDITLDKEVIENYMQDEILVDDLIGMNLCDEKGNLVGQVVDFENYGASDILTILENGHEYQVPFIKQIFIQNGKNIYINKTKYDETKI